MSRPENVQFALRRSRQIAMIERLLVDLRATVPFYERAGSFEEVPIVSKRRMLADLDKFISRSAPGSRAELLTFLASSSPDGSTELQFNDSITVDQTSGSSGVPFRIAKSKAERIQLSFGVWRYRRVLDPAATPARFYPIIHAPVGAPRLPWSALLVELATNEIRWIHANPPILAHFLAWKNQHGHRLPESLKFVENSGQRLDDELRKAVETNLGLQIVDQYGCREVSVIGYATRANRFTTLEENTFVELIDDNGLRIDEPGIIGHVVLTSLHCRLMPFVRYDTGDLAEWVQEADDRYLSLQPHRDHHLIIGSRGKYGPPVFKDLLIDVYRRLGYPGINHLQIRQRGPANFELIVNRTPDAEAVRVLLEQSFNATRILPTPAAFSLRETEAPNEALLHDGKVDLFTNR